MYGGTIMLKGSMHVNNGIWHVSFRIPDGKGGKKQKQLSTGVKAVPGNKKKAQVRMREILDEWDGLVFVDSDKIPLTSYINDWISRTKMKVQVSTYDGYVHMFRKHIYPYFDERKFKISDLKPRHLEEYYMFKISEGLSPNTLIKHHAIIRTALQDAVKNGYIKRNVADLADKPKRVKPVHDFYTAEELKKLITAVTGTSIEIPVFLAILFGLRRSEVIGLKWSSIDFDSRKITICNKVIRCNVDGKITDVSSDELKSDTSYSTFYMNDAVYEYLSRIKSEQDSMIRESNEFTDFICVDAIGNRIKVDYVTHKFKEILEKNGLRPIRFHDLRHSCISLLVKNNFNMKTIQEYARHADYNLTANTYSHVEDTIKKAEIDSITNTLFSA